MSIIHDVTDIAAWQLAHKLNLRVDLFLLSPDFRRHYKHVDRLREAVQSAPRHIAAGFEADRQSFADRVRLAKGSQAQVLSYLDEAYGQRLITIDELQIAQQLTRRSIKAANGLIRSLESTSERRAAARAKPRIRRRIRPGPTSSA